jgi:ribulose-5-phosphate 4-epimerase/fuculose-1-phosphate aldolase
LKEFPPYPFNGVVLIRDSGFQCEINPLVDAVGADNLMIVRVNRPGYDFSRDSREWVTHKHVYEADNSAGLTELKSQAETLYTCLTQFLGWKL